ncbi:MAG: sugar-binding domain-containing protein [Lentisphaerota bacterium]
MCKLIKIMAILFAASALCGISFADEKKSLAAFWEFKEGAGNIVNDSSGNNNNGKIMSLDVCKWGSNDNNEPCLIINNTNCSGKANVRVENSPSLQLSDAFTIIVSFSCDLSICGEKTFNFANILTKGWNYNGGYSVMLKTNGDVLVNLKGLTPEYQLYKCGISSNTQNIVAVVYDEAEVKVYANGKLAGAKSVKGKLSLDNAPLFIGNFEQYSYKFKGNIYNAKILNKALSAEELKETIKNPIWESASSGKKSYLIEKTENIIKIDNRTEDFGTEDALHIWHSPKYIMFGAGSNFTDPASWKNEKDLSGRISIKTDDNNLYIVAEVKDDVFSTDAAVEWENDGIELFISCLPHQRKTSKRISGDYQVLLTPGNEKKKPYIRVLDHLGKTIPSEDTEIFSANGKIQTFDQTFNGWFIKAKLPLRLFPEIKQNTTGYIDFNIIINDRDTDKFNRCYIAGTPESYLSVKNYMKGFLGKLSNVAEEETKMNYNAAAKEYLIPAALLPEKRKSEKIKIWDKKLAATEKTFGRESICLNGIWAEQTFTEAPQMLKENEWNYLAVPIDLMAGRYEPVAYFTVKNENLILTPWLFYNIRLTQAHRVFYREIDIPSTWENSKILLDIAARGIVVNCEVYINGSKANETAPCGPLDISKLINGGAKNKILVIASALSSQTSGTMGLEDVWLRKKPAVSIESCAVKTSVKNKNILVDFTLSGGANKHIQVGAEIRDCLNNEKVLEIDCRALSNSESGKNTYQLSSNWDSPKLWSFEHPNLYKLIVYLTDEKGVVTDSLETRFGFREVEIDGKNILVNGIKTHLRIYSAAPQDTREMFIWAKNKGFNAVFLGFNIKYAPEFILNWMDELGLYSLVMPGTAYFSVDNFSVYPEQERYIRKQINHPSVIMWICDVLNVGKEAGWSQWNYHTFGSGYLPLESIEGEKTRLGNAKKQEYLQKIDPTRIVAHYTAGNHPPVYSVMNHSDFGLPVQESGGGAETWANTATTKPFIMMESWPWAGTGYNLDFWRMAGAQKPPLVFSREGAEWSLAVEQASQYFGAKAYQWAEPIRTKPIARNEFDSYWTHFYYNFQAPRRWDRSAEYLSGSNNKYAISKWNYNESALLAAGTREQLRGDRGYGLSGRCCHINMSVEPIIAAAVFDDCRSFEDFYNPASLRERRIGPYKQPFGIFPISEFAARNGADLIKDITTDKEASFFEDIVNDALSPVLIYIGGGPAPDNFRQKDHTFISGEKIIKNIVLINDNETAFKTNISWQLGKACEKPLARGTINQVEVPSGETLKLPIETAAPLVAEKTQFQLSIEAAVPNSAKTYTDSFNIEVFPAIKIQHNITAAIYDAANTECSSLLAKIGVKTRAVSLPDTLKDKEILIIGKNSLKSFLEKAGPSFLTNKIEAGLKVLIMEQNQETVYGPWMKELRLRDMFIKNPSHPLLSGLDNYDFSQWRGCSSMSKSKPQWEPASEYSSYYSTQMFGSWGTEGIISSFPVRRPQYGNVKTLLAGGFDQEWAAMLEIHQGAGVILISQLDICGRDQNNPAADILLLNMIKYLNEFKATSYGAAVFCGSEANKNIIDRFNLESVQEAGAAKLLIADASETNLAIKKQWLNDYVKNGGKNMLLLWPDEKCNLSWISPELKIELPQEHYKRFYKAILSGKELNNPLMKGFNTEDFYYKFLREDIPLITSVPNGSEIFAGGLLANIKIGKGNLIICQLNPSLHDKDRSFGKVIRSLSNLFTNLEVKSKYVASFTVSPFELSQKAWSFKTDHDDKGEKENWFDPKLNDSSWKKIFTGQSWESQGVTEENPNMYNAPRTSYNGIAWYRCAVDMPEDADNDLELEIGAVAGADDVWFNGQKIGATNNASVGSLNLACYYRNYLIPKDLILKQGNVIAVKVTNLTGVGGVSKWPVRIMSKKKPNRSALLPMEKDRVLGDPYRYLMW